LKAALKNNRLCLSSRGLTLMELVLAFGLLAITISGFLLLMVRISILNETTRNKILAYNALQSQLEIIKGKPYAYLCPSLTNCPTGGIVNGTTFSLTGFPENKSQARVEIRYFNNSTHLKNITVYGCFQGRSLVGDSITNCRNSPVKLSTLTTDTSQ